MNKTANDVPVFIRGGSIIPMQFPLLPQGGDVDTLSNILIRKRGLTTDYSVKISLRLFVTPL